MTFRPLAAGLARGLDCARSTKRSVGDSSPSLAGQPKLPGPRAGWRYHHRMRWVWGMTSAIGVAFVLVACNTILGNDDRVLDVDVAPSPMGATDSPSARRAATTAHGEPLEHGCAASTTPKRRPPVCVRGSSGCPAWREQRVRDRHAAPREPVRRASAPARAPCPQEGATECDGPAAKRSCAASGACLAWGPSANVSRRGRSVSEPHARQRRTSAPECTAAGGPRSRCLHRRTFAKLRRGGPQAASSSARRSRAPSGEGCSGAGVCSCTGYTQGGDMLPGHDHGAWASRHERSVSKTSARRGTSATARSDCQVHRRRARDSEARATRRGDGTAVVPRAESTAPRSRRKCSNNTNCVCAGTSDQLLTTARARASTARRRSKTCGSRHVHVPLSSKARRPPRSPLRVCYSDGMRAAVVVFPGLNADAEMIRTLQLAGAEVTTVWHTERRCRRHGPRRDPRRLQLRRLPALRRHRKVGPIMRAVADARRARRLRPRRLQRLPDPDRGGPPPGRAHAQRASALRVPRHLRQGPGEGPFSRRSARCCACPSRTARAATRPRTERARAAGRRRARRSRVLYTRWRRQRRGQPERLRAEHRAASTAVRRRTSRAHAAPERMSEECLGGTRRPRSSSPPRPPASRRRCPGDLTARATAGRGPGPWTSSTSSSSSAFSSSSTSSDTSPSRSCSG